MNENDAPAGGETRLEELRFLLARSRRMGEARDGGLAAVAPLLDSAPCRRALAALGAGPADLRGAIRRLGLRTALELGLVAEARDLLGGGAALDRAWAAALAQAVAAETLDLRLQARDPLDSFRVGFVAGLGPVVALTTAPRLWEELGEAEEGPLHPRRLAAERRLLGRDRVELAARELGREALAAGEMAEILAERDERPARPASTVLRVAAECAVAWGDPEPVRRRAAAARADALLARTGLFEAEWELALRRAAERWAELALALGLPAPIPELAGRRAESPRSRIIAP